MDAEWLALILEAKELGLTPEDVRKWIEEECVMDAAENIERIVAEVGYSQVGNSEWYVEGLTRVDFEWLIDLAKRGAQSEGE